MSIAYSRGLHELGDGLFAYLQPEGGWGWSNAGLVAGEGESLLIDTLFDLSLTRDMLEQMRPATEKRPIRQAMNTHGNGDHWFGNQLLPDGIPIIATTAAVQDMRTFPPALMGALANASGLPAELETYVRRIFGPFEFSDIEPRLPTETFDGRRELLVDDRRVELIEVGPAHTAGDAIVHVPGAGVVFTGDVLFIQGTPIVWAGPISNWVAACQRILELDARVLVPGHGPITDHSGVRDVQRYLEYVQSEAEARFQAGLDSETAADDIDISSFRDWGEPERIVVNVATAYGELDPEQPPVSPPELFARMARWSARH
jgi:glyoxylase-like metal-dependent hydrolase (beta-lactamase superfamily II)